jgi:site-specific DNA recombinase
MIAALYARVSTSRQAEKDLSIPDQLRQMKEWCKANDYAIAFEYVEPGASATDDRRPIFQKMILEACSKDSHFSAIVVHSLSRFYRDMLEFCLYERRLKKYDVKIISITQQTSDDPAGEMARKMFNLFDEYQSKENAKHTLRAMKENARLGFFNGSTPLYGYRVVEIDGLGNKGNKKRLEIDPAEAELVKTIFDLYLNGKNGNVFGIKGIASHLNSLGITRRGKKWSRSTIHELLKNRAYIGEYFFNKKESRTGKKKPRSEWVQVKINPIIDIETFELAGFRRDQRSSKNSPPRVVNTPTLLTGLLKCGYCGSAMTIATGKGGRYRYYKCNTKINHGIGECENRNIRMEKLDKAILEAFAERIFTPSRVENILNRLKDILKRGNSNQKVRLKGLKKEFDGINEKIERLYEAVENGLIPLDETLKERAQKNKARREEILIEIASLKRKNLMPLSKISASKISAFCSALKVKLQDRSSNFGKEYLRLLVDEIRFKGKEVIIRGRYSALAGMIGKTKPGLPHRVPGFGLDWLPETDSNRQPSG